MSTTMSSGQSVGDQDETLTSSPSKRGIQPYLVAEKRHFRLLDLPSELTDQILGYLSPVALANICQTCRRFNQQGSAERLWKAHLEGCTPYENNSHEPYKSWKELYGIHFPYWFLLKRKVWFSDRNGYWDESRGALLLVQWDTASGNIVLYHLHGINISTSGVSEWTHDSSVRFINFAPRLNIYAPVYLWEGSMKPGTSRLQQEALLAQTPADIMTASGTSSSVTSIFPAISIPPKWRSPSMALWPPTILPATEAARRESPSAFRDPSHKPETYEQMCTAIFRLRRSRWQIPGTSVSHDGFVETYSTILPEYFVPTPEKPYQGLWVGDYSTHGCEFILVIQNRPEDELIIPVSSEFPGWRDTYSYRPEFIDPHLPPAGEPDPPGCSGSLYAIKLTGDRNVPRGEISWVAPDISRSGLVRVAHEPEFYGARVVSSAGHIAQDRFTRDRYTPCHLIMISENLLAQHWLEMSHISFFKRIDVDEILRVGYPHELRTIPKGTLRSPSTAGMPP